MTMPMVKTASSIERGVFRDPDQLAKRLRMPRSKLVAQAAREFIRRDRVEEFTERIKRAHAKPETEEERSFRSGAMEQFRLLTEGTWREG